MEELVSGWLNKLKSQMKEGIPEMGIPPLDPLVLRDYSLGRVSLDPYGSIDVLDIGKLTVNGIPAFDIARIKVSVFSKKLKLNLSLPKVRLEGHYNLDGRLFGFVPVRGSGPFHVEISDVVIITKSKLKTKEGKFKLKPQDLSLEIGRIQIHFEDLCGGGDAGDRVNRILQRTGDFLLVKLGPIIIKLFAEIAREKLNEVMQHVDFKKSLLKKKDGQKKGKV